MKKNSNWLMGWVLLAVMWVPALGAQDGSSTERIDFRRTILVTGNGEASAPPDRALVRLGTTAQTSQAETAQAKVNETMTKALDLIQKAGVEKRNIRTAMLRLSPVYTSDRSSDGPKVTGFRASNVLEVTLDDLKLVGKVIDAGLAAGMNELQGVSFSLKNDLPQRNNALKSAAEEARVKAETIAEALGLTLSTVYEVTESGVHLIPFQDNFGGARMMSAAAMPTPVEPGEVRVQANVTVRYEFTAKR